MEEKFFFFFLGGKLEEAKIKDMIFDQINFLTIGYLWVEFIYKLPKITDNKYHPLHYGFPSCGTETRNHNSNMSDPFKQGVQCILVENEARTTSDGEIPHPQLSSKKRMIFTILKESYFFYVISAKSHASPTNQLEAIMRIGGVAHQAEYLITSFLVKDAPLWYVVKRLTHLNQNIVPIRTELQVITHNYKFGGLTVAELPFHDKRNTEVNDVTVGFEDKTEEILYQLVGGTESLQVISILGMPGLVSQTYETQSILANILSHINSEMTEMEAGFCSLVGIIHELPFLSDEQCWELLEKKVFGSRTFPPQLHGIGKKIAARCCGLPLTVVVIAGALSTVDEKQSTWEEVRGSLASYIDREDSSVMQILELSYKYLPDHLKPCFLYFGEFEEDEEIFVGELKRLWVAEGFIRKEIDKSAENIAGEYFMELINKSLVMIAKRRIDGRGAKSCVVHDLLRDLCLKKSKEECFLKYLNNEYHTVYENGHRVRAFNETATLSYCQHVRSFVGNYLSSSFYVRDMRLLRVLHFKGIDLPGRKLTFGIEYLINLRYLVIGNLPPWIDRLVNLEYLRIASIRILETKPTIYLTPAIVKLKKLRYLHAKEAEYGKDWNISNQTNNLEYLSRLIIRKLKDEEGLKCSPHLHKLKCKYHVDDGACPHFDLRFLTRLDSLFLEGFLIKKNFGFPSNIRKLSLYRTFLPWEKMSVVGRLECLEVLNLFQNAFVGERWDTRGCEFQKPRFLRLHGLSSLREWNVASDEHFPKLQQLILDGCTNLQEIPSELGEITALELIEVIDGPKSVAESAERIKEEQRDMGNEELRVIIGGKLVA
ncbi:hypothetical protein ACS0TY_022825 [Phlomoides rotata]